MKYPLYILAALLFCLSCKKDDEGPVNEPTPVKEIPVGAISNYDALFSCIKLNTKAGGTYVAAGNQVSGYYSSVLINNETYTAANLQNLGGVLLNSVVLKTKSSFAANYYNDTTATDFMPPYNWQILGSSAVDSFSYVNNNPPPSFPLAAQIPDSLRIGSGFTVRLKGTTGCDLVRAMINGGPGSALVVLKLTAGTDSLIQFTPAELKALPVTSGGLLTIQLFKDNYRNINGKKVNFRTGVGYSNTSFKIKQ